jgi:AcrR family transcriptional regulator
MTAKGPGTGRDGASDGADAAPRRLPGGRHGLSREAVRESQRDRMVEAMIDSVSTRSYAETTVADVIGQAGVSRATFYEHFRDKEDCFIAAYQTVMRGMLGAVAGAFASVEPESSWVDKLRVAIGSLFGFIGSNPVAARVGIVEAFGAGSEARNHYQESVSAFFPFLDEGRKASSEGDRIPPETARLVVGGISAILYKRASEGEADRLGEDLPAAIYLATVPYLGHESALEAMCQTDPILPTVGGGGS